MIRSRIREAIAETVLDLYEGGFIDAARLKKFKAVGILEPKPLSPLQLRRLRQRVGISQAVFAHYLGISKSTVAQWEQGAKKPSGTSLKLLRIIDKRGLEPLLD